MTALRLARCSIVVTPGRVETMLPNGLVVVGEPHDTDSYRETTRDLGYGDDVERLNRCHELTHSLLAAWLGLPASPTFERVAWGLVEPTEVTRIEEAAVMAVERYANRVGVDLEVVARGWGK